MTEMLLEVNALSVSYRLRGGVFRAVDGVSFRLGRGRTLGIVGESGSGKSSLARAILQLEPHEGSVSLLGELLEGLHGEALRRARRHMQAVFQDPLASLNPHMTVRAILEEPLRVHERSLTAAERLQRVRQALRRVGLDAELLFHYPHELSGGQCQRIAIARAVICNPALLVCDEAVSALDASVRGQVLALLEGLRREMNIGIIFIAHDMTAVRYLCDEVMVMEAGRVVEHAARDELFQSPRHPRTRALLDAVLEP